MPCQTKSLEARLLESALDEADKWECNINVWTHVTTDAKDLFVKNVVHSIL